MSKIAIIVAASLVLFSTLKLANNDHEVVIITKQKSKRFVNQLGSEAIAGILDKTNSGAKDAHIIDTLQAGDGLCNGKRLCVMS